MERENTVRTTKKKRNLSNNTAAPKEQLRSNESDVNPPERHRIFALVALTVVLRIGFFVVSDRRTQKHPHTRKS